MTKEFKNKLDNLEYISMADFCIKIDGIKNIDDKLDFATQYLLLHKNNIDYSFAEAINIARMKIADALREYRLLKEKQERIDMAKDAFSDEEEEDIDFSQYGNFNNNIKLEYFMGHPKSYLRDVAALKNDDLNKKMLVFKKQSENKENYQRLIKTLDNINDDELDFDERKLNNLHIKNRLETKFASKKGLSEAYNKTKPGFFARLFRTTSQAGKNLDIIYKAFNNPNHRLYGNKEALENAANEYIMHKFPKWKPNFPLVDIHRINSLNGTSKARMILSTSILEALRNEKKSENDYNEIINFGKQKEYNFENIINEENINQNLFHHDLRNNIDDSFEFNFKKSIIEDDKSLKFNDSAAEIPMEESFREFVESHRDNQELRGKIDGIIESTKNH